MKIQNNIRAFKTDSNSIPIRKTSFDFENKSSSSFEFVDLTAFAGRNKILVKDTLWKKFLPTLSQYVTDENFLGAGGEASVYKLNDKYVLRLEEYNDGIEGGGKFRPVEDVFEGRNFGQAVAKNANEDITINKFVEGVSLFDVGNCDVEEYLATLRRNSEFSDEILEGLVEDIAFINNKGYRIDPNSENFLLDNASGRINIIDIYYVGLDSKYRRDSHIGVLDALISNNDFANLWGEMTPKQRQETLLLIKKIENRILPFCEKHGISKTVWDDTRCYDATDTICVLRIFDEIDCNRNLEEQVIEKGLLG